MPALTDVRVDWVSLVDRPAVRDAVQQTEPSRFLLWKRETPTSPGGTMTPEEKAARDKALADLKKTQDDLTAALASIETQKAEIADLKKAADPEAAKPADIDKSELPPAVRAALEKAEADNAALAARVEKAETDRAESDKLAKAERETRLTREFITKAEGFKALVVKADEFGPVLKEASEKLSKEAFDAIETVLKAADEQIAAGDLFKEQGRGREGAKADSAYAEAVQKAEKLMEGDSKLTKAQAVDRVLSTDRALAERYIAEQR